LLASLTYLVLRRVLELGAIEHIHAGLPLVDTRPDSFYREATIPGARNVIYQRMAESIDSLDQHLATIFFCNGPQCAATPSAVDTLLGVGYPAASIIFYLGGIHDWMTMGRPIERPA
jgi:rhodanese-related sulfurtransferase